jgi:hypothetical protein
MICRCFFGVKVLPREIPENVFEEIAAIRKNLI